MPEGSWAWYHKTYRFPDRTEYWDGEHPAPNRARAAASIENIQQSHKFVSIIDMKQTKDDYQLKMFPTNTYYHFTTVELSTLEITSKPKSVIITTVKHTKYSTARRDQKTIEVTILYFLIKNAKLNMSLIGDLKLEAMEQDEEGPQILHKITQPTEWADLTFTVLIASKYNKEGSVNIALTDKIGNKPVSAGSVDIPWALQEDCQRDRRRKNKYQKESNSRPEPAPHPQPRWSPHQQQQSPIQPSRWLPDSCYKTLPMRR